MTTLILAGGGDAPDSKPLDTLFLSLLKQKKILYIPIAWKDADFNKCHSWFNSTFYNLGFTNTRMWTDIKNKKYEDLEAFGGIYLGGGNTFSLLHDLKSSNFKQLLSKFIDSNRPVYGGSAGAIVFGKSIETASFGTDSDTNDVKLKDFSGFNLVNDFSIQCHYDGDQDKELLEFSKSHAVIALSERTGLLVQDKEIKVIGFESAYVFRDGKKTEFKVGSKIV